MFSKVIVVLVFAVIATFVAHHQFYVAAQQQSVVATLTLDPPGNFTLEHLNPISNTDSSSTASILAGIKLPPVSRPLQANVKHFFSKQPLLGIEVEILAALWNATASKHIILESWQDIDGPAAPALPIFANSKNFTDNNGTAKFPNLTPVRGCLPPGTQLVARTVFNTSATSPTYDPFVSGSSLINSKIVRIFVVPSMSTCSGRILSLTESVPSVATPSDIRVLDRIATSLTSSVVTAATNFQIRSIVNNFIIKKMYSATTTSSTTSQASSTSTTSTTSTSTTTPTTSEINATSSTTSVSPTSTVQPSTVASTSDSTTTSLASTTLAGGTTSTTSIPSILLPKTSFQAAAGFLLPIRSMILDSCGNRAAGFVLADSVASSDSSSSSSSATSSPVGSSSSSSSLLSKGWISGSLLYETNKTVLSAEFDWVVHTSEVNDVKATFFLPHHVDRTAITLYSLNSAAFTSRSSSLPSLLSSQTTSNLICDIQTIGISPITSIFTNPALAQQDIEAKAQVLYGPPIIVDTASRPVFAVEQNQQKQSLLPIVSQPYDESTVANYLASAASSSAASSTQVPAGAPGWFVQLPDSVSTWDAMAALLRKNNQQITVDGMHSGYTRVSVVRPLAARSTATLRGAIDVQSLKRPVTSLYAVPLLRRLLQLASAPEVAPIIKTEGSIRLEGFTVQIDGVVNTPVTIEFSPQNPVPQVDPRRSISNPLKSLRVQFSFRQDVIFPPTDEIRSFFDDVALFSISGSPLLLYRDDGLTLAPTPSTSAAAGVVFTTPTPSFAQYAYVETSIVYGQANDTVTVEPTVDVLYATRAAFSYISFLSLFGRRIDASVVAVTRYSTLSCRSDTYMQYDASLHPLQFIFPEMKNNLGPGLNYAVSTLIGNFLLISIVLATESIWYLTGGRDSSTFPLHSLRIAKFLYGGTALALVHINQFTPNVASTFASGIGSFAFMIGVPIALAALAFRAQLNWKPVFMFQPTAEDQKKALALQKLHGANDDTLSLMKNRMLISLGYGDAVHLHAEDIFNDGEAAANSVHLGWIGFVLQRLFLPPGHYILTHRDHYRARAVFERYRSDQNSNKLWLFCSAEMVFQLFLAMSYSIDNCSIRFAVVLALHSVKLVGLSVLLPLLSVIDNLIAIIAGALLVAASIFELRGDINRAEVAFAFLSIFIGITNFFDALSAVTSSKRVVALIIAQKKKAAKKFNQFATEETLLKLRLWSGFGLIMMLLRQREAGIELQVDRHQIRQLLFRGAESEEVEIEETESGSNGASGDESEDGARSASSSSGVPSKQQSQKKKQSNNNNNNNKNRRSSSNPDLEQELLVIREHELHRSETAAFLFDDEDVLTESDRKMKQALEDDANFAASSPPNNNSNNNNGAKNQTGNEEVHLDGYFERLAQEFVKQGAKFSKWAKQAPGGMTSSKTNTGEEHDTPERQRQTQRFDFNDRSSSGTGARDRPLGDEFDGEQWELEREKERKRRVLEDPHALDRFMRGDDDALDYSPKADLSRTWVDPTLFERNSSYKLNKAMIAAEMRKNNTKGRSVRGKSQHQQQRPTIVENNNYNINNNEKKPDSLLVIQHLLRMDTHYQLVGEDDINDDDDEEDDEDGMTDFLNEPLFSNNKSKSASPNRRNNNSGRNQSPRRNNNNTHNKRATSLPNLQNATFLKTSSGQMLYIPPTDQQIREQVEAKRANDEAIYNLRHFYHNCSAKAQREVDEVLAPLETQLFERGEDSSLVTTIREPLPQVHTNATKSAEDMLNELRKVSLSNNNNGDDEYSQALSRNARRLRQMKKDPTVYLPAFQWKDPSQLEKFEKASALHPLLSSALNPQGAKFVSKYSVLPDGSFSPNVSRIRVRKIAEVEDELGNAIAGRVVVDDPIAESIAPADLAAREREKRRRQLGLVPKSRRSKNNVKKLLLATMLESGAMNDGVVVDTTKKKKKNAMTDYFSSSDDSDDEEQNGPNSITVVKRELAGYKRNAGDDDDDLNRDDDDEVFVRYSRKDGVEQTSNPIGGETRNNNNSNGPKMFQQRSRNQLQEVFRQADKRDRRLANKTFGTDSMLAQARLYALAGDSVKLSELSQYNPQWFKDGKSVEEEARNHHFVGIDAITVAQRLRDERGFAPEPLMRINVDAEGARRQENFDNTARRRASGQIVAAAAAVVNNNKLSSDTRSMSTGMSYNRNNAAGPPAINSLAESPFYSPHTKRYQSTFIPRVARNIPVKPQSNQLK